MAKRKKKAIKAKAKRAVKTKKAKKPLDRARGKAKAEPKEKVLGKIDHFFDHISVAAVKILAPIKVGDIIHIKGHTTDFVEKLESMQIEHQDVKSAKKGDDIGIKVKEKVRDHDIVYLASPKEAARLTAAPSTSIPSSAPSTPAAKQSEKANPYSQTKFMNF